MLQLPDPADCQHADCDWDGGRLDVGDEGATYLFFLEDALPTDPRSRTQIAEEEPGPSGPSFTVYRGAYGRLSVTYDRVRYSTPERHRTEFARDMTGCAFLEQLREELLGATRSGG